MPSCSSRSFFLTSLPCLLLSSSSSSCSGATCVAHIRRRISRPIPPLLPLCVRSETDRRARVPQSLLMLHLLLPSASSSATAPSAACLPFAAGFGVALYVPQSNCSQCSNGSISISQCCYIKWHEMTAGAPDARDASASAFLPAFLSLLLSFTGCLI